MDVYLKDYLGGGLSKPVFERGIPGMSMVGDYGLFVHIHTPADNMDVVSPQRLDESLDISETVTRGLCSMPQGLGS